MIFLFLFQKIFSSTNFSLFSTGVGRTGVFIALCNLIERVKTEGLLDVFRVVRRLKTQRPGMVQTKVYLHYFISIHSSS